VTVLVAGLLIGAAPGPKEDDAKKEVERLQGTWKAVSIEDDGKAVNDTKGFHLVIEKETLTINADVEAVLKGTFKLDLSKKPRTIDVTITEGKGDRATGKQLHGIYELDKETLKWCTAEPGGKERPTEFGTKAGTKHALFTLKRQKP
jgi:uncharacterized protein (TIGR03067 family)